MPTAPSLVAFAEAEAAVASGAAVTTPSVAWQANDVVVCFVVTPGATGGETQVTPTTTGSGISFGAPQKQHQSTGSDCGVGCWAAVASAGSSGTFSEAATHSASTRPKTIGVYVFRGSAGIGNSNIYQGATPAGCALTPTGADCSVAWAAGDWAAAAAQSLSPAATSHGASAPGPTASPVAAQASPDYSYYVADIDDQTSAGQVSYGIGGSGTGPFTTIAIEVKAAAGGGATSANAGVAAATGAATGGSGQDATGLLFAGADAQISGTWAGLSGAVGGTQGDYATWTDSGTGTSAVLELSSFAVQAAVPAGATVGDVKVRVRHSENPAAQVASVTAQCYLGTSPYGSAQPLTVSATVHEDEITVTGLSRTDLADLRVRVTATRN